MDTSNLHGRLVLVTGAGSGIGRATALLAASRGARLAICDVNEAGLREVESEIDRSGREVLARKVDVSDRAQMAEFAEAVHGEAGVVDLLVNNAGVGLGAGFLETELEDWDWIVPINLMGVVHGCHFFIPRMVERRQGGHVTNVSSVAGFYATPSLAAYNATKFAVLGLSQGLRAELHSHGIGVTAICPGIINTPITESSRLRGVAAEPGRRDRMVNVYRRRNYGPERVAENILKAVARNRAVAPISPEAWFAYGMTRVSPRLATWTARKLDEAARRG
jgi:NAD(P)-dependent dehydrogenase (short-subunit alcohol dehydrogenase family)